MSRKRLVPLSTEPKCSVCKSGPEKRATVDEWLSRQMNGDSEAGERVTLEFLTARLPMVLGHAISDAALKRHRKNHCRIVGEDEDVSLSDQGVALDAESEQLLAELDALLEDGMLSPSGLLSWQLRTYLVSLRRKLAANEAVPLTHDQAARAAQALVNAERRHGTDQLLGIMGQAISSVFEKALGPESEVVDAEVVAEIEAGEPA